MPFPSETVVTQIQGAVLWVADEFTALYSQLTAWLSAEHKDDGTHGDVTADSLAVEGELTVGDDIVLASPLAVGNGPGIGIDDWAIAVPTTAPLRLQVRYVPDAGSNARALEFRYISSLLYVILPGPTDGSTFGVSLGDPTNVSGAVAGQRKFLAVAAENFYGRGRADADATPIAWTPTRGAAAGTWTLGTVSGIYWYHGGIAHYRLNVENSTLSLNTATVTITLPVTCAALIRHSVGIFIAGVWCAASLEITAGGTIATIERMADDAGVRPVITAGAGFYTRIAFWHEI
jgi:hypothetical protein